MPDPTAIIPPQIATNIDPAIMSQMLLSIGGTATPPSGTTTISATVPTTEYNFNEYFYDPKKWNTLDDDQKTVVLDKEWQAIRPTVEALYASYKEMETLALKIRSDYRFSVDNYFDVKDRIAEAKKNNATAEVLLSLDQQLVIWSNNAVLLKDQYLSVTLNMTAAEANLTVFAKKVDDLIIGYQKVGFGQPASLMLVPRFPVIRTPDLPANP